MNTEAFRPIGYNERDMLLRLLDAPFPGRDELLVQVANSRVRPLHADGSFEIEVAEGAPPARVHHRVPVEASTIDSDNVPVDVLLHVVDGKLRELEVVKADSSPLRASLRPESLTVTARPKPP